MSDMQSSKRRRKSTGGPQPFVSPRNSNVEVAYTGPIETYRERDEHRWFLEDLYGKQDDLPRDRRGGRG